MTERECIPFAPALIESMRSLGYSFPAAIADLIDNSISASAKNIEIYSAPSDDPYLVILDDGQGMSKDEMFEAMRYGSSNPLEEREQTDLGRFGLGMKSASLSQCRKFVIASKKDNKINAYSWDLDYVMSTKKWALRYYSNDEMAKLPLINKLEEQTNGTYLILLDFDRIKETTDNINDTFTSILEEMIDHISLVFHRYIEEGLTISVNNCPIEAKDPFLSYHPATIKKREISISIYNKKIQLKPFILPHPNKLKLEDKKKVGGVNKLLNDQGFYVYRNKRLIIWGTWFRLARKEELNKQARVRVDIPNSLDYLWKIDVKKSNAYLPDVIKNKLRNAVLESVNDSEKIHTYRGRKEKGNKEIDYIWEKIKLREGNSYIINRNIPQIKLLEEELSETGLKLLGSLLSSIENSLPIGQLYLDAAKGEISGKKASEEEIDIEWNKLQNNMDIVKKRNLPVDKYYKAFMKTEPYCNYPEIIERIKKELEKHERSSK